MSGVAFFDFDGTIVAPKFLLHDKPVIGFMPDTWKAYCQNYEDAYRDSTIVPQIFKYAKNMKDQGTELHILTTVYSKAELRAKLYFFNNSELSAVFSKIHFVQDDSEKKIYIDNCLKSFDIPPEKCTLVEDTLRILYECIPLGINLVHTSHILTDNKHSVLHFDKPKKVRSTKAHNEMYQADDAPPGVYVPNMSESDMMKWKAKQVSGSSARVEIRKTVMFPKAYNGAQMVCIVYKDLEGEGPAVKISTNNKLVFTLKDWEDLKAGVDEAFEVLRKADD